MPQLDDKCYCDYWAHKMEHDFGYKHLAVTFTCPVHGQLTFDRRKIPPPVTPVPQRRPWMPSHSQGNQEAHMKPERKWWSIHFDENCGEYSGRLSIYACKVERRAATRDQIVADGVLIEIDEYFTDEPEVYETQQSKYRLSSRHPRKQPS